MRWRGHWPGLLYRAAMSIAAVASFLGQHLTNPGWLDILLQMPTVW